MAVSAAKQRILDAALELFSLYGYEATSVGQIADAVGIKKPSLYSHFVNKQAIFDALVKEMVHRYEKHSLLGSTARATEQEDYADYVRLKPAGVVKKVREQLHLLTRDPFIWKTRRMLTIEQFRNSRMAAEQEKRAYTDVLKYHTGLMRFLIDKGVLREGNPEIMALQYVSPISLQLYRMDRNPECEPEAMRLIEQHILQFAKIYRIPKTEAVNG